MKHKLHIVLSLILLLAFAGCEVHEFPTRLYDPVPFQLHLEFNTELPLYKEVIYTRSGDTETKAPIVKHDVRYIINAYRIDKARTESRMADTTFVFTRSDLETLNYTAPLEICEGTYEFRVWCDYIDAGSKADKYYDTRDFSEIILADKENHCGSNDFRDAFRGSTTATVMNPDYYAGPILNTIDNQATVQMMRPMGKFKFISTDADAFFHHVSQEYANRADKSTTLSPADLSLFGIDLNEFIVEFRYNIFMPCSFNMFTDKPADSWTGMRFPSRMYIDENNELALGFDYAFVNGSETTLSISVAVYNKEGEQLSLTNPINVPIVRSKLTIVRGEFLTSRATGGVVIDPSYDGDDYNVEII